MKTCNKEHSYKWAFTTAMQIIFNIAQFSDMSCLLSTHWLNSDQQDTWLHMVVQQSWVRLPWLGWIALRNTNITAQNCQLIVFVTMEFSQSLVSIKTNWARHRVSFVVSLVHLHLLGWDSDSTHKLRLRSFDCARNMLDSTMHSQFEVFLGIAKGFSSRFVATLGDLERF